MKSVSALLVTLCLVWQVPAGAASNAEQAEHGMVVSANASSSAVGVEIMKRGGNAIDAAVAVAFSLAVTHPTAGNIGGGGFLVYQGREGAPVAYDFREVAPGASHPEMWLVDGDYSYERHHLSHLSVGVPGTVAGLYLAWQDGGSLPWAELIAPAIEQAKKGIVVTDGLARSLAEVLPRMQQYPASVAKFTRGGELFEAGDLWKQPDLAAALKRIADKGPDGFYKGRTADLIVAEMQRGGGIITHEDLAGYEAKRRTPIRGTYRGYEVLSMPPPSSGGVAIVEMLNMLEGYDIAASGFGSVDTLHVMTEVMRRAYADRARYLGDPDYVEMPLSRLTSKAYADELRRTIRTDAASVSSPESFTWPAESPQTTHFSVVDKDRNAVSLTYTLEYSYGSGIVVPGGGFLLNNEMGDFNAGPGLTDSTGLIGTSANLAEPGKRMLSSMSPTIVNRDGEVFMVTGTPGGRTIINTVLQTILNVIDHGANAQTAVDLGRVHHQWLPDTLYVEGLAFSPDTLKLMEARGHTVEQIDSLGVAEVIVVRDGVLEGGVDRRQADGGVAGY
ncbi:MAG: gamma-glutamyltransferase [Pseudomonadales bacterium]